MKVRLKTNLIADGKFYERDSIVDDSIIPEHLKTEAYVAHDMEDRGGRVLILRDLAFQSLPSKGADGVPTSFPVHVMAGALLDLSHVPASHRQKLKEGSDYAKSWTREQQKQLQKAAQDAYQKQFETEPAVQPYR
jgi:hypothetical protein